MPNPGTPNFEADAAAEAHLALLLEPTPQATTRKEILQRAGAGLAVGGLAAAAVVLGLPNAGNESIVAAGNTIEITGADLEQFRVYAFNPEACEVSIAASGTGATSELLGPIPDYGFKKPVNDGVTRNQDTRLWSEGLRNPMTTEDKLNELFTSICEDDVERAMVGQFLGNLEIDGVRISELEGNEWLVRYAVSPDQINDVALQDMPLFGYEGELDPNDEELVATVVDASARREADAERMIELLNRLQKEGVITGEHTVMNYRLAGADLTIGVPEVEPGPEYTGDFLVFTARTKGGDCVIRIGFNIDDQRLAVLVCEAPTPTTVPGQTTIPGSDTTRPDQQTTITTGPNAKIVYCLTPNGSVAIDDRNRNGLADEPECMQLQDNGPGTPNGPGTEGTTSTTAADVDPSPDSTPTTGVRPTIPPAPPITGTPPPPTVVTIPAQPQD